MTLREAAQWGRAQVSEVAELQATAALDAEVLLLHRLQLSRAALYAWPDGRLNYAEWAAYEAAIARRVAGEPIQYITGSQEFFGLPFAVSPGVLIPRPETELLVEAVLERLPQGAQRIADVGTGSGAIAVAIASRRPEVRVLAIDLSPAALAIAQRNAAANGIEARIEFQQGDLLAATAAEWLPLDAVVSNPPYIPAGERASLERQVRDFEPELALFAGEDGMAVYDRLLPEAWERLRPGGLLALELGMGQESALRERLQRWDEVQFLHDLRGIARTVVARRPCSG